MSFPHVRRMTRCLSCGGRKTVGFLLCFDCHNDYRMLFDGDIGYYTPDLSLSFMRAERQAQEIYRRMEGTKTREEC